MKKTIIALLFMFSIVLVGCDESTTDLPPNPGGENPPGAEYEAEVGTMPDPGDETEDNSTDSEG